MVPFMILSDFCDNWKFSPLHPLSNPAYAPDSTTSEYRGREQGRSGDTFWKKDCQSPKIVKKDNIQKIKVVYFFPIL